MDKNNKWAIEGREEDAKQIWKEMNEPIPEYLLEKIRNSDISKSKSKSLFRWGMETSLTLDYVDKDLDVIMISGDPNTNESISLLHSCKTEDPEKRIDRMIWLLDKECSGNRTLPDGTKTGNELFTAIANVVAMYVGASPKYREGFEKCVEYWQDRIKKNPQDFNSEKIK